jgi:hypothetical protein
MRRWSVILSLALAACQGSPTPPRQASDQVVKDQGTLAAEALERGDYAGAAEFYRSALGAAPESLPFRYGLGVAASYLDRRAEAVSEFTWVLERGEAGSSEVKAARRWLASVGALPRPAIAATARNDSPAQEEASRKQEQKPAPASVQGRVVGDAPGAVARMQLFLYDYPNRAVYYRIRTDEEGRFRFANVPPGIYKLTERAAGQPTWRLRLELKPGQDLSLDLIVGNSTRTRDDFPEPTGERPRDPRSPS